MTKKTKKTIAGAVAAVAGAGGITAGVLLQPPTTLPEPAVAVTPPAWVCHYDAKENTQQSMPVSRRVQEVHLTKHEKDTEGKCKP